MKAPDAADLRRRAEDRLQAQSAPITDRHLSEAESQRLIHELQVHQIELEMQNEELRETRARLEQSLERYTDLYDFAPVGYFTVTGDGTIRELNLAGAALLGQERSRLFGRRLGLFVSLNARPAFNAFLDRLTTEAEWVVCEVTLDSGEGAPPRHVHLAGAGTGTERRCRLAATDITERMQAERALRATSAEKEVLLREVHHRVKNNLAAIIDLLELQRESMRDAPTACRLVELGNRIRSMALVHEMLYQSADLDRIDFREYLQTLVAHLRHAFDPRGAIRIDVAATGVYMDIDTAIPCGLIVNELVINALKYAFPGHRPGAGASTCEIVIAAAWDGAFYTLTVADNGAGLPAGLDWATTRTLGLRLVRMLGQHQLGGQIELDGDRGTRCSLRFAPKHHLERADPHDR